MSDTSSLAGTAQGLASGAIGQALSRLPVTLAASGTSAATSPNPRLAKAAHDFEAIFMRQLLAESRKTNMGDSLTSNNGTDTFRQMQEARFADIAAARDTLGIAKLLERHLSGATNHTAGTSASTTTAGN